MGIAIRKPSNSALPFERWVLFDISPAQFSNFHGRAHIDQIIPGDEPLTRVAHVDSAEFHK